MRNYILTIFILSIFISCKPSTAPYSEPLVLIPIDFPSIKTPQNNPLTKAKIELGKKLFYDKKLSKNDSISCASCHNPQFAFADSSAFSKGIMGKLPDTTRNASALFNLAYDTAFFWDGRVSSLEEQAIQPILNKDEMGLNESELLQKLNNDKEYIEFFKAAFDTIPTNENLKKAIASFVRTLISGNSRYDMYQRGDKKALNQSEINGMQMFFDETADCHHCHDGYNFTNHGFANNGSQRGNSDIGKMGVTGNEQDLGKFKVPSLRNVALTAPYMHDGSFKTLEEVVENYNSGGLGHINQNVHIHKLNLSATQKSDLIAFLKALTDSSFIENKKYLP